MLTTKENPSDVSAEVDAVRRTVWGEARGGDGSPGLADNERDMHAVANVIMNRVNRPSWWGRSITEVCYRPYQFSCHNADDPNRHKLKQVDERDPMFKLATEIAVRAVAGQLEDITGGATHYHTVDVRPSWVGHPDMTPLCAIGRHVFYRED